MNRAEFLEFHKTSCEKMHQICIAKNADYAGPKGENPFANFSRVEHMGVASTEQGFLTRMIDKVSRLSSFVSAGVLHVKDESVEDTLLDLANYCILFAGYLRSKKWAKACELNSSPHYCLHPRKEPPVDDGCWPDKRG